MRRIKSVLFWVIIGVLVIVGASVLYNTYKPEVKLQEIPEQKEEDVDKRHETNSSKDSGKLRKEKERKIEDKEEYKSTEDVEKNQKKANTKSEEEDKYPAPDFSLEDIKGKKVKLSDYKGKIVFLNFWALWCPYCIKEMPDLNSANSKLIKEDDAVVLTVNVMDSKEKVKKFVADKGLSLPVLLDSDGKVADMYRITGYPTTYVIGKDGAILGRAVGTITEKHILDFVEKAKNDE